MTEDNKEEAKEIKEVKSFKQIKVIQARGESAVVEWVEDGKVFRKIAPVKKINDEQIEEKVLDKCPDYGVAWAKEIELSASPEDMEKALHNAGIWTAEDALRNSRAIIGALNAAYKTDLASIINAAKKYINKE